MTSSRLLVWLGLATSASLCLGCERPAPGAAAPVEAVAPRPGIWPPAFNEYATTDTLTGPAAELDLAGDPDAEHFRTRLSSAKEANFAGHYAFVTWGCGTACLTGTLLDLRTGRPHSIAPLDLGCGLIDHNVTGRLVVWGPDTAGVVDSECRRLSRRYFVLEGESLRELRDPRFLSPIRDDSVLRIPLRNGDSLQLLGRPGNGEQAVSYAYLRHLEAAPFHLVRVQYYETSGVILIHDSTGRQTKLRSVPVLSPDGTELLTFHHARTAESGPSQISIYRLSGDSLAMEWQFAQEDEEGWGPKEVSWRTADTIQVIKAVPTGGTPKYREVPTYIARAGSRWLLQGETVGKDSSTAD
jgi:hypothetical protein